MFLSKISFCNLIEFLIIKTIQNYPQLKLKHYNNAPLNPKLCNGTKNMAKDNGFKNINVISKTNATHKTNKLHSLTYRWKKYCAHYFGCG